MRVYTLARGDGVVAAAACFVALADVETTSLYRRLELAMRGSGALEVLASRARVRVRPTTLQQQVQSLSKQVAVSCLDSIETNSLEISQCQRNKFKIEFSFRSTLQDV